MIHHKIFANNNFKFRNFTSVEFITTIQNIQTDYYDTIRRNEITKQSDFAVTLCIEGPFKRKTINEYLFDCFYFESLPRRIASRAERWRKKYISFDQECLTFNNSRLNRILIVCSIWEESYESFTTKPQHQSRFCWLLSNETFDWIWSGQWTYWTWILTLVLCISHLHANPKHYFVFFFILYEMSTIVRVSYAHGGI